MRRIGTIPSRPHSERFQNYLESKEIPCRVDPVPQGWEVWIYREDQLETARDELNSFLAKPDAREFNAPKVKKAPPPEAAEAHSRKKGRGEAELLPWQRPLWQQIPLTLLLIAVSVAVAIVTNFGEAHREIVQALSISTYSVESTPVGVRVSWPFLRDVAKHGEVWRLFTPMFLHFGWLHLGFNMYMTWQVAGIIEYTQGTRRLFWITFLIAPASHLTQFYVFGGGPQFGGMSGALFGWFGYLWARGVLEPRSEIVLPRAVVYQLLAWLLICFTGIVGPVANWAHVGGLVAGLIVGGLPPLFRRYVLRYR